MIRGLSAAVSGLTAQQTKLAVSAHNVANATTDGFKRSVPQFQADPAGGVQLSAIRNDSGPAAPGPGGDTDLSEEAVAMIVAIGAYQANIKSVQTLDSLLKTVINLRR